MPLLDLDLLKSEALAWPMSSVSSFKNVSIVLRCNPGGWHCSHNDNKVPDPCAEDFENWIAKRARGHTLDTIRRIYRKVWYGDGIGNSAQVRLDQILCQFSFDVLEDCGSHIALKQCGFGPSREAIYNREFQAKLWRWLSLSVSPELLIAGLYAPLQTSPRDCFVDLTTPQLKYIFQRGLSETHFHLGAGFDFAMLWARSAYLASTDQKNITIKNKPDHESKNEFKLWFFVTQTIRFTLGQFLDHRNRVGFNRGFKEFFQNNLHNGLTSLRAQSGFELWETLGYCAASFYRGRLHRSLDLNRVERLLRLMVYTNSEPCRANAKTRKDVFDSDPLRQLRLFQPISNETPELLFLVNGLRYIQFGHKSAASRHSNHEDKTDSLFEILFWQYVRRQQMVFRYLVERPGPSGLEYFCGFYERIDGFAGDGTQFIMDCARRLHGRNAKLDSLEVRIRPKKSVDKQVDRLHELAKAWVNLEPDLQNTEFGAVMHFVKEYKDNLGAHAAPIRQKWRFARYFKGRSEAMRTLKQCLKQRPWLLFYCRGIDVANREPAVPNWVFFPIFKDLIKQSKQSCADLLRIGKKASPLRITMHLGEDYNRLASGLRQMHEPIEFGLMRTGDRMGHGAALGIDPRHWQRRHPVSPQRKEERLDDLCWELDLVRKGCIDSTAGRIEFVRQRILCLSSEIYGRECQIDALLTARRQRHCPVILNELGFPLLPNPVAVPNYEILFRHLTDIGVYARGQQQIEVRTTDAEVEFLNQAQSFLKRELNRLEIVIEGNPSSNLLIADIDQLTEHPALRLMPIQPGQDSNEEVRVTFNDDNPLVFSNNLPDEYTFMFYTCLRMGIDATTAQNWIERVRVNAERGRFTVPESKDIELLRQSLNSNRSHF